MPIFPSTADVLHVNVGGLAWGGWQEVNVTRAINKAAGAFRVRLVESVVGGISPTIPSFTAKVKPGDECTVTVNGQLVLTGYVDRREAEKDAETHQIDVIGRSKTQDVVDSSIVMPSPQFNNLNPSQITQAIAAEYGLAVVKKLQSERPIPVWRSTLGEPAIAALHRLGRLESYTVTDDEMGNVVLINKFNERAPAALIAGENILRWTVIKDTIGRYGSYEGRGQSVPTKGRKGKKATQVAAQTIDKSIRSTRKRYVVAEGDVDGKRTARRTTHEAARRAGFSLNVGCVVAGWTANGGLWKPGQLVFVFIPDEGIAEELLIESVSYEIRPREPGTRTEMKLVRREAYEAGKSQGGTGSKAKGPATGGTQGNNLTQVGSGGIVDELWPGTTTRIIGASE